MRSCQASAYGQWLQVQKTTVAFASAGPAGSERVSPPVSGRASSGRLPLSLGHRPLASLRPPRARRRCPLGPVAPRSARREAGRRGRLARRARSPVLHVPTTTPSVSGSSARPRSASTAGTCRNPGIEPLGLTCRVYRLRDGRISALPDRADIARGARGGRGGEGRRADDDRGGATGRPRAGASRHRPVRPARCPPARRGEGDRGPSGPATTAPTRSPGTTAWSTPPSDYADPWRRASSRSTPTTPSAIRPTRWTRCASASTASIGRSRTCGTPARTRRGRGPRRSPRTCSCSTPELRIVYEGAPDADHRDPAPAAPSWLRAALDAVLAGGERRRPTPSPVGCSIKWSSARG